MLQLVGILCAFRRQKSSINAHDTCVELSVVGMFVCLIMVRFVIASKCYFGFILLPVVCFNVIQLVGLS